MIWGYWYNFGHVVVGWLLMFIVPAVMIAVAVWLLRQTREARDNNLSSHEFLRHRFLQRDLDRGLDIELPGGTKKKRK